jgi:hypothetical protein
MMKKKLAMILLVLCLMIATPLKASPLYGGYNGQSTFWVDLFVFGIDDQIRWWVRVPVPLIPGMLNLNFKYESSGAISAEIAGHNFFAEERFYAGIDTAGVVWFELSDLGVSGGTDTSGNSWSEQALIEFLGTGTDSNDRMWGFAVYDFEGYQVKAGIDLSFLITEPSLAGTSIQLHSSVQQNISLLSRVLQGEKRQELITFITALSRDEGLRKKVESLDVHSFDLQSLLKFAEEEVFTEEKRKEIESMVEGLINPDS